MNDTPPTSDKKPRRRGAPRKRAPAKAVAKKPASAKRDGDSPADAAPRTANRARRSRGAAVAAPVTAVDTAMSGGGLEAVAAQSRGDSPAADDLDGRAPAAAETRVMPTATDAPASGSVAPTATPSAPAAKASQALQSMADVAGQAASASDTAANAPRAAESAAGASEAGHVVSPSPRADAASDRRAGHRADAARTQATQHSGAPPRTELRQESLRPGELIRVPLSVRWRDLDAFNHVNNSKYLSYLEEARLRWMLTIPGMGLDDDVAPVVAASNLNYRRPIGWPGDVVIELFVERLGTTSVAIGHRIVDASEGGVTYCDGNVVMVWIDRTSGRAAPLPEAVRASCARR